MPEQIWCEDVLAANLSVLDSIYPNIAKRVRATPPPDPNRYRFTPHPEGGWTCRDCRGVDVHGPTAPMAAAEQSLSSEDSQSPGLFLIVRPGLGYLPQALYPRLRKGRNAQRMLIAEDRWELLRAAFALLDWRDMLRSDRVILVAPDNLGQAVVDFFVGNPVGMLQGLSLLPGANLAPEDVALIQQLTLALSEMGVKVQESTQGFLREIKRHYATRKQRIGENPDEKRKILLVQPEHDYLAGRMIRGFKQAGWDAEQFLVNQRLANFLNPWLWLIYVRERFPDVLFWMNRNTISPEGAAYLKDLPIPKVLWYLDNPSRVKVSKEELQATDLILSFEPGYLPFLEEISGKPAYHLPNAPGLDVVRNLQTEGPPPERKGPEVGFVGALAAHRFQEVRGFWLERDPEFVKTLDGIVDAYLENPEVGLREGYIQAGLLDRLPYEGFVVLYLEERATYFHRKRFLEAIAGEELQTFGAPEWSDPEIAGSLASCHAGWGPDYETQLADVYFNTRININLFHVQCLNSSNPRIYDVLLTGSFVLTEYRPILEEEFEIGKHLDVFRSKDELRDKVRYYREHPEEREVIAREGQRRVLENYTFEHRMRRVIELVKALEV